MTNYYIIKKTDWIFGAVFVAATVFLGTKILLANASGLSLGGTYVVTAVFMDASGIEKMAPVRISGVDIGRVESITLTDDFSASVKMSILESVSIPKDSSATASISGLLERKFINILPGGSNDYLRPNETITITSNTTWDQIFSFTMSGAMSGHK